MSRLEDELRENFRERLKLNQSLAEFTSFRIGGPADLFVIVESEAELMRAKSAANRAGVPTFCLGHGTNLLVSDRGIRGLVIRLGEGFNNISIDDVKVTAGAGVDFGELVKTVVERGLEGLEFGEGIPGTVGGGLVMNAGAFGGEIARVVTLVHGVTAEGEARALTPAEVNFAYRRTNLPPHFVISRVDFELHHGDRDKLRARVVEVRAKRAARQPRGVPNAGSIFKNPPGNFAGRLLEARRDERSSHRWRGVFGAACQLHRQSRGRARRRRSRADRDGACESQAEQWRSFGARSEAGWGLVTVRGLDAS